MLDRIMRINVFLILLAVAASGVAWRKGAEEGLRATIGVGTGGAIVLVNFWAVRRIITGMLGEQGSERRGVSVVAYAGKVLLLFGVVAAVLIYLPLDARWFAGGVSTLVGAVLLAGAVELLKKEESEE